MIIPKKSGEGYEGLNVPDDLEHVKITVSASCPKCGLGHLDYDGMLNLVCPVCGWTAGGCFT